MKIAILLVLAVAAILGNHFGLWLFPGVEILFGSIAVLAALRFFGLAWGLAIALLSVIPVYASWHHPFGPVLYVSEALVVGLACRRGERGVALADACFWLLAGAPATWLLYYFAAGIGGEAAGYLALRNLFNGLFNAFAAYLLVQVPPLFGWLPKNQDKASLRQVVFNMLLAAALIPVLVMMVLDIRHQQKMVETGVAREMKTLSVELERELADHGSAEIVAELRAHDRDGSTPITLLDSAGRVIASSRGDLSTGQLFPHDRNINLTAFSERSAMATGKAWMEMNARYWQGFYYEKRTPLANGTALLVEIQAAPHQAMLREAISTNLLLMLGVVLLAFPAATVLSMWLAGPLTRLAEVSGDLAWKMMEDEDPGLPRSPVAEIDVLIANFMGMALDIRKSFRDIALSHGNLEVRVEARTRELSEANRQLELEVAERKHFEMQLAERAQQLESTLGELEAQKFALDQHSIVAITDRAGRITYANDRFCEISEYSRQELLGQNHRILNSGYHSREFFSQMWAAISRGEVWRGEVRNRKKYGSLYWVDTTIVPFLDMAGHPYQFVAIRTDITARKAAEESLLRLNRVLTALNACSEALVHIDDEAQLLNEICRICVNIGDYRLAWVGFAQEDAARSVKSVAMAGFERGYLDNATITWNADDERGRGPVGMAIRGGGYHLVQDVANDPAMRPWLSDALARGYNSVIALPFYLAGEQAGVLTVYSAMTSGFDNDEIALLEEMAGNLAFGIKALRLQEARKKDERELVRAKEVAEQANKAKSEFLSRMSHELRTPLNAVIGFAQLLESDPDEPLTAAQKESTRHILGAGWHLLALVNEVLDLSRIESGRMSLHLEVVELNPMVSECVELVMPLASEHRLRIEDRISGCDTHYVKVDRIRLKQVVINLLSNAVKYNRQEGHVLLTCDRGQGYLRLCVEDGGAGIPADKLGELFVPFSRLDADKTEIQGTGVGLAVAKRLVELMGGRIGVDSRVGKGSRFWVEIPECAKDEAAKEGEVSLMPAVTAEKEAGVSTVLYIEDNAANLELVASILKRRRPHLNLLSATNAERGLELARNARPDAILLDMHLPGMGGLEAMGVLRMEEGLRSIPVVVVSADAMPRDVEMAMEMGVAEYVTKPIEIGRLLEAIDSVIKQAESAQSEEECEPS